ncbi:MAG: NINE protein [Bacteroidota bacterium]
MKNKKVAAILAFLFGTFGTHRFYLGQRARAFLHLGGFIIAVIASIQANAPLILIPALIGFIDAVLFAVMPKEEFDHKYNQNASYLGYRRSRFDREHVPSYHIMESGDRNPYKSYGIEYYKDGDYEAARSEFQKALGIQYEDPATHFNLACCYSQMEEPGKAISHLSKAIEYGFNNFDRIHDHEGLYYLRTEEIFEEFVDNGYRLSPPQTLVSQSPPKKDAIKEDQALPPIDLLEQLNQLGKLRDMGLLTEEEFVAQKKKILK